MPVMEVRYLTKECRLGDMRGLKQTLVIAAIPESVFRELPVTARHAIEVRMLPQHHRDPFDRMLVAQSRVKPSTC